MVSPFKFWSLLGSRCFPFRGFGLTPLNRWKGAGRGSALLMSVFLGFPFFLGGSWPRFRPHLVFYSKNGDGFQDSWLRSSLIMSTCFLSVSLLFHGSWQRHRPHFVFFGAPNTNKCCMLAEFFFSPSPLAPPHLPPREKTQGNQAHTRPHTIRGTFSFFFTSTQAMFSCFSSLVHTRLTLPWLVLSRFLLAI